MKRLNRENREGGFSLVEVTVAALLTVGLMGVVFNLLNRNQQVFVTESSVTDMNENMRTSVDLLTRDVQSAGMGLPRTPGSFAAVFYLNGASGASDSILIVNGDPFAAVADVSAGASGVSQIDCIPPTELAGAGTGTYTDNKGIVHQLYRSYANDPSFYVVYDDTQLRVIRLNQDGQIVNTVDGLRLRLQHPTGLDTSPATTFGSPVDTAAPNYGSAKIAKLLTLTAYRLNRNAGELERTEDLQNWYPVSRGVIDFQVEYRVVTGKDADGNDIESVVSAPADRRDIRSVIIKIVNETPDLEPIAKGYRKTVQKFEVTPRNFNLLNNTNLSAPAG
jgi:hypothetical protein